MTWPSKQRQQATGQPPLLQQPPLDQRHGRNTWQGILTNALPAIYSQAFSKGSTLGIGALLAKLDLRKAYRVVPVHPDDHALLSGNLGCIWSMLGPKKILGCRGCPGMGVLLQWREPGWQLHYLDDFLFLGPPEDPTCTQSLQVALDMCQELGMPVAMDKVEGPAAQLTFLGIHIDTVAAELSLPTGKLTRMLSLVNSWLGRKAATKRELQSPHFPSKAD